MSSSSLEVGVVVIGRNEGQRLIRCLESIGEYPRVYVDSGSSDNSVEEARKKGGDVVQLDMSIPFSAARARNEGFSRLLEIVPGLKFVMFVDGDCSVVDGFIAKAVECLDGDDSISVVCGRRKELFPDGSIYNLMCDIEWDTPVGVSSSCGGDAVYRVSVFKQVSGFDPRFIAGEEPELCFRIRDKGGNIMRIEADMTRHDAAMTSFFQWWNRARRSGFAYFLNYYKHGARTAERFKRKEVVSILFWFILYILGGGLSIFFPYGGLGFISLIFLQLIRMTIKQPRVVNKVGWLSTFKYSFFSMLAKVPQCLGVVSCWWKVSRGESLRLVEYK